MTARSRLPSRTISAFCYEDMPERERHVIERVAKRLGVARDINRDYESGQDLGGRLADHVASFGGSWTFLIIFGADRAQPF